MDETGYICGGGSVLGVLGAISFVVFRILMKSAVADTRKRVKQALDPDAGPFDRRAHARNAEGSGDFAFQQALRRALTLARKGQPDEAAAALSRLRDDTADPHRRATVEAEIAKLRPHAGPPAEPSPPAGNDGS